MFSVEDHGNRRGHSMPRSIVRLDGYEVRFHSWSVNLNAAQQADDFSIDLPFRFTLNQSQPSYLVNTPEFPSHLLTKSNILVEIFIGFPRDPDSFSTADLTRLMFGYVDSVDIRGSASGESVSVRGRNMTKLLLDTKTTEDFRNSTSSRIAETIAARHGFQTAITPTYTLSGTYYNDNSVEVNHEQSEWDLLNFLAEKEGFELRVRDNTLSFGPFEQVVGQFAEQQALAYTWGQNVIDFSITRSPHASKHLEVEVHSYQSGTTKHVIGKATRKFPNATTTHTERYFYPGLTQEQAQNKAESLLNSLSRSELTGSLSVPGNDLLVVDRQIALYGVGQSLSQVYYIRQAAHSFDFQNGYRSDLQFSNILMVDSV